VLRSTLLELLVASKHTCCVSFCGVLTGMMCCVLQAGGGMRDRVRGKVTRGHGQSIGEASFTGRTFNWVQARNDGSRGPFIDGCAQTDAQRRSNSHTGIVKVALPPMTAQQSRAATGWSRMTAKDVLMAQRFEPSWETSRLFSSLFPPVAACTPLLDYTYHVPYVCLTIPVL
jgi:hypothetical protein